MTENMEKSREEKGKRDILEEETERKKIVRVVTALVEPFVMVKRDCETSNSSECSGNSRFEG